MAIADISPCTNQTIARAKRAPNAGGIMINGIDPEIHSYVFSSNGKEWAINRFVVDGIEENIEINIEYAKK
jgi:altronate dehydratase